MSANTKDGLVLLAKQPGLTSFSSLFNVKKALDTTKVGHTGTLDSFAQGLLVVCTGRLTRLAGNITEFDKSYKAVIKFGEETDTLEYTGKTVKTAPLPKLGDLKEILKKYTGPMEQIPPAFSAIHVDGKRASDLMRSGKEVNIQARKIVIYEAKLVDYKLNCQDEVEACLIDFTVSKGTYIRSLARDIANDIGSAGHLIGLFRTKVGSFKVEDAAGYSLLEPFTIESSLTAASNYKNSIRKNLENANENKSKEKTKYVETREDAEIKKQILTSIYDFSEECALLCGFKPVHLIKDYEFAYNNGKPLLYQWFKEDTKSMEGGTKIAVFDQIENFRGLILKADAKRLNYTFVINVV